MPTLPPVVMELTANASKLSATLDKAKADVDNMAKSGASSFEKFSATAQKVGTAIGAAMTGAGAALQAVAGPLEKAHAALSQALQTTGNDMSDFKGRIDAMVSSQEKYGHTSADTQQALAKMTLAFNDPKKALDEMAVAADLAAFKHISLADASGILIKASAGSAKAFKEFGINLKDFGTGADATQKAMDLLAAKLSGQASAAANTTAGKFDMLRAKITDVAAGIGQKLAPVLMTAGPLLMGISQAAPMVGSALTAMTGPWGVAAAAIGITIAAVALFKDKTDQAIITIKDFGTEAEAGMVAKLLAVKEAADAATAAMLRQKGANGSMDYAKATDDIDKYVQGQRKMEQVQTDFNKVLKNSPEYAQEFIDKAKAAGFETTAWQQALNQQNADLAHRRDLLADNSAKIDALTAAGQANKASQVEEKDATKELTQAEKDRNTYLDAQTKAIQKDYDDQVKAVTNLGSVFGEKNADMIRWTGMSSAAMEDMAKMGDQTKKTVDAGFDSMGSAVETFAGKTKVSAREVLKFYTDQAKAATEWEGTVKKLLQSGLEDDIINPLIAAGPKANALAKATLEEAAKQGPEVLNTLADQTRQAKLDTEQAVLDTKANVIAASSDIHDAIDGWARNIPQGMTVTVGSIGYEKRAMGGPVNARQPYIVGEKRPEVFVPSTAGTILPSVNALGGGQTTNYFTINAGFGADPQAIGRAVKDALKADARVSGYGTGSPILV